MKIHEELDRVVGKSGKVTLSHKQDLPYLQATILESYRCFTTLVYSGKLNCNAVSNKNMFQCSEDENHFLFISVPHMATRNATLQGYNIPKGTVILPDFYSVHRDPQIFPNPDKFDPEHFLGKAGAVVNSEYCIPFSLGRYNILLILNWGMHAFLATKCPAPAARKAGRRELHPGGVHLLCCLQTCAASWPADNLTLVSAYRR